MRVLAVDTSSERGSVCITDSGELLGEVRLASSIQHSDRLFRSIDPRLWDETGNDPIALLGAIVGVALAYWAVDLLAQITSTPQFQLPYWIVFTIDAKVLGFTLGAVLLATFVSGLVPALLAARGNASEMMKEGGRGNSSRLVNVITRILVVGQIAMTAALLIASALQVRSIRNQVKLDYGYDDKGIFAARSMRPTICPTRPKPAMITRGFSWSISSAGRSSFPSGCSSSQPPTASSRIPVSASGESAGSAATS